MFLEFTIEIKRTSQRSTKEITMGSLIFLRSEEKSLSFINHTTTRVNTAARSASMNALIGIKSHL